MKMSHLRSHDFQLYLIHYQASAGHDHLIVVIEHEEIIAGLKFLPELN